LHIQATDVAVTVLQLFEAGIAVCC